MRHHFIVNEKKIARIAMVAIFLALIRTLGEIFRLQYAASSPLTFETMMPFLIAATITAVLLFAMTLLVFYERHRMVVVIAIADIIIMLVIKGVYL